MLKKLTSLFLFLAICLTFVAGNVSAACAAEASVSMCPMQVLDCCSATAGLSNPCCCDSDGSQQSLVEAPQLVPGVRIQATAATPASILLWNADHGLTPSTLATLEIRVPPRPIYILNRALLI